MTSSLQQAGVPGPGTRLLTGADIAVVLDPAACYRAVETGFRQHADGTAGPPGMLGVHVPGGGFHLKSGLVRMDGRSWFAAKLNANFPGNSERRGLPTIQGVILLSDGENGRLLAVLDSISITALRTAAATAVAAQYLARKDARVASLAGCGVQGRAQLRAVHQVRPLERVMAFDLDWGRLERFAIAMSGELGIPVEPVGDFAAAAMASDLCITCTPSTTAFVTRDMIRPGTFVAGVGADSETKSELDPGLLAAATVVVDVLDQAATIGDLHHAISAGTMSRDRVHAELGQVVLGERSGRTRDEEITVFDSTGMGIQDAAAAVAAYQMAVASGCGSIMEFAGPPLQRVVFVCEHGAAKSVLAAGWFNQLARQGKLAVEAVARGTAPDPAIAPRVLAEIDQEGLPGDLSPPKKFTDLDLEGAFRLVTFDQSELPGIHVAGISWDRWDGLPPVSDDYAGAREAILARVSALVREITATLSEPRST